MSSDKVAETRQTVVESADKTKVFGEEKAGHAQEEFDAANKEAEAQLDAANKSDDPSFVEQAKQKAAKAKEAAGNAHQKVNSCSMTH